MTAPTLVIVRRVRDARFAVCRVCGVLEPCQFWGPSTQRALHQDGTGHRVDLANFSTAVSRN